MVANVLCTEYSTRVVTKKINGHRDKRSSNLPHVSSVNNKIAQTKWQNILNNAYPDPAGTRHEVSLI